MSRYARNFLTYFNYIFTKLLVKLDQIWFFLLWWMTQSPQDFNYKLVTYKHSTFFFYFWVYSGILKKGWQKVRGKHWLDSSIGIRHCLLTAYQKWWNNVLSHLHGDGEVGGGSVVAGGKNGEYAAIGGKRWEDGGG